MSDTDNPCACWSAGYSRFDTDPETGEERAVEVVDCSVCGSILIICEEA